MIGLQPRGVLLQLLEVCLELWVQCVLVEQGVCGPRRSQCLKIDMNIFRRRDPLGLFIFPHLDGSKVQEIISTLNRYLELIIPR